MNRAERGLDFSSGNADNAKMSMQLRVSTLTMESENDKIPANGFWSRHTMAFSLRNIFFPRLPKPVSDAALDSVRERRIRSIVASVATGNVSLQQGAFLTSADIEKRRQKIEKHGHGK